MIADNPEEKDAYPKNAPAGGGENGNGWHGNVITTP